MARLLAEVLTFDVTYHHLHKKEEVVEGDNERWSLGHGFPSTKNFIQSILPKLTLNFHNPGLGTALIHFFVCNADIDSPGEQINDPSSGFVLFRSFQLVQHLPSLSVRPFKGYC